MPQPYDPDFIPTTRVQAISLLLSVDDELDQLTEAQRQALRRLYFIDGDNRTVEQMVREEEQDIIVSSHQCSCDGKCKTDSSLCGLIGTPECKREDRA